MDKQDKMLTELLYHFGSQAVLLGVVLAVLNREIPNFKHRLLEVLEQTTASKIVSQAMIEEAIDYVKTLA